RPQRWGGVLGGGCRLGQVTGDFFRAARPFHQCVPDLNPDCFEFAPQLMIPETQHLDAVFGEKLIPFFVPGPLVREAMSAAIEFDRKLCGGTVEIQEVDAARMLAAELEFIETMVTQHTPQALLGVGGFRAELTGEIASGRCAGAVFTVLWRSPPHL